MTHKPTIAFDFDGVLYPYLPPFTVALPNPPIPGAVEFLNSLLPEFDVVVFSTRASTPAAKDEMRLWMRNWGFADVEITHEKPGAVVYIDDRAWCFKGLFPSIEELRSFKPWIKRYTHETLPQLWEETQ